MKRTLRSLLAVLALGLACQAQNLTNVTATILDPSGLPYANGTVTFQLVNASGAAQFSSTPTLPTTPATPVAGSLGPFGLSPAGVLNINLPSNGAITPAGTLWVPTVCSKSAQLPLGTGLGCFTVAGISISGSSQDISATLNASSLALAQTSNVSRIYATLPAAGTSSISATTMATAPSVPSTGTNYAFSAYASTTAVGTSCGGNSTVAVAVTYQDPNEAAPAATTVFTYTITTNGTLGRMIPAITNPLFTFRAKAGTVVQYSTTYTADGACAPAPTVQIFPTLQLN